MVVITDTYVDNVKEWKLGPENRVISATIKTKTIILIKNGIIDKYFF